MTQFLSHRGESDDAPENTVAAFHLAMERDSDGIELDIRLTADRQVACLHNEPLEAVAGVPLAIADSTLAELRRHWPVPTLAEALAELRPGKIMQIELKSSPELIPHLKTVLDAWPGDRRQLMLSAFDPENIAGAAHAFPDLPRIWLADLEQWFGRFPEAAAIAEQVKRIGGTGISFLATEAATAGFVRQLHEADLRVVCWGVNSDELGLGMAAIGVDAMTSNHAVALRRKWRLRV